MSGDRSGERPSAGAMSGEGEKLLGRSMEAKLRIEIASSKASSSLGGWIQELDLTRGSLGQALSHLQAGYSPATLWVRPSSAACGMGWAWGTVWL